MATGTRQDPRLAVSYVLLELVVVPAVVLLLAMSSAPAPAHAGRDPRAAATPPATPPPAPPPASALRLPAPASEPGAVLLVDPGTRAAR